MNTRDLLRLVIANLNRMRMRVLLTAIGVIIGTAAVIVLISLGVALQTNVTNQFSDIGELTEIQVYQGNPFAGLGPGTGSDKPSTKESVLNVKNIEAMRKLPHVVAVTPEEGLAGQGELKLGRKSTMANIQGVDARAAEKLGWKLASGAARLGRGQVVVGQSVFADDSGGGPMFTVSGGGGVVRQGGGGASKEPTPSVDKLQGKPLVLTLTKFDDENQEIKRVERLRVAGVFDKSGGGNDYGVFVALEDVEDFNQWFSGKRRNPRDGYNSVRVKVDKPESVTAVQSGIRALGFTNMFSPQAMLKQIGQSFVTIQAFLGGIGAIALLVAAFGIANTMTMAIYERTKEIGIMKAIGATNRDVLQIFLSEAGAIGFIGGVFGVGLGWLLGKVIDIYFTAQQTQANIGSPDATTSSTVVTPLWLVLFALLFATIIGVLSGVYPALRAASMKPLRALRTE